MLCNGAHFFDIATSKNGPNLVSFVHFDLETCFARQRRAIFFHLSSGPASWLRTRLSEPTFRPSWATNHWKKNTVNRDFPTFSRTCIFFLLSLSLLWSYHFCSSPPWLFPPLLFHLSTLSEVWLLNFLRPLQGILVLSTDIHCIITSKPSHINHVHSYPCIFWMVNTGENSFKKIKKTDAIRSPRLYKWCPMMSHVVSQRNQQFLQRIQATKFWVWKSYCGWKTSCTSGYRDSYETR